MKVGLVCPYSLNKQGGVQEVVLALHKGLKQRGHDVKIITPMPRANNGEGPVKGLKDVIHFGTSIDFRSVSRTTAQISSTADNEHLDEILDREKFDILHFHEPWIPFLSRQLLQRSKSVNIATLHSNVPESMASRSFVKSMTFYLRSVMKYLHVYTAVSEAGADYFANLIEEPIVIVPNGVDLKKFSKAAADKKPLDEEEPMILFIGRLEGRKGVKYLLSAFQTFSENNRRAKLVIVGDGPEREKLELLAEDLKISNISFLGHVSEKRKLELLSEADLMVSPAVFGESFGIVLLEAMATNTVCVAGNNPGYEGVMQGIGALSLVNPEDTKEFARRMHMLIHERQLRSLWLKWSPGYVKQFDYPIIVKQYEDVYKEALKSHGHVRK